MPHIAVFQSSARINTGCNSSYRYKPRCLLGFNPQPASTRAATPSAAQTWSGHSVFQSSARINTGCNGIVRPPLAVYGVSILSPHQHGLQLEQDGRFALRLKRFNPQPASTRAATQPPHEWQQVQRVSILSPHQHGLQRRRRGADIAGGPLFQSSARINTGCNNTK